MHLVSTLALLASTVAALPQSTCSNGAWQCSGQALQQCSYGAGNILGWTTIQTCGTGTYCTTSGWIGCASGQAPQTTAKTSATTVTSIAATTTKSTTTTTSTKASTSTTKAATSTTKTTTTTTTQVVQSTISTTKTTTGGVTTSPVPTGSPIGNNKYKFITYWGQNSGKFTNGQNQLHLIDYCNSKQFDVINIAFLSIFGGASPTKFHLDLDFFGAYDNVFGPPDAASVANFLQWGQEVAACQAMGIKIILSLGGGVGSYSVPTGTGTAFAKTLHNSFFGGSGPDRPFGNVVLDGIDWDLEGGGTDQKELVIVNQYLKANNKNMLITAAPQCPYPDAFMGDAFLAPNAGWSFISVQFYNNYCSLDKTPNFEEWAAAFGSLNIPLAVGVPGSKPSAPGGGYVPASTVQAYMKKITTNSTQSKLLYGAMTWDASSTTVSGMSAGLRSALDSI
ncbi:glycoside hydrolase superfamily [Obelidium mucronatum]|nr:glycoside hydrolase superfamily [Obelidium mucronatum]